MFRRLALCLLAFPLAACVSSVDGRSVAAPTSATPPPTTTTSPPPPEGAYTPGDCLAVAESLEVVPCDEPHEYEITLSGELPPDVPDTFPPELDTVVGPACRQELVELTGSEDVEASLVEAAYVWPREPRWQAGERWYSCLASGACEDAVSEYLGGERDGVGIGMSYGSPEQWPAGYNTGTCMAVSDVPVTGLVGAP